MTSLLKCVVTMVPASTHVKYRIDLLGLLPGLSLHHMEHFYIPPSHPKIHDIVSLGIRNSSPRNLVFKLVLVRASAFNKENISHIYSKQI